MDQYFQLDMNTIDEILGNAELGSFQFLYLISLEGTRRMSANEVRQKKTHVNDVYKGLV